jgi:hypothetical protein
MKESWEIEAEQKVTSHIPLELARSAVILHWMSFGRLEPLADAIRKEHPIDRMVLNTLAEMIADNGTAFQSVSGETYQSTYRLESKRRNGKKGRPWDPSKFVRQFLIAKDYRSLTKELGPRNSEKALEEVSKRRHVSISTVLKARSHYKNK